MPWKLTDVSPTASTSPCPAAGHGRPGKGL